MPCLASAGLICTAFTSSFPYEDYTGWSLKQYLGYWKKMRADAAGWPNEQDWINWTVSE